MKEPAALFAQARQTAPADALVREKWQWVIPFRQCGTRPPLFCACAGGGDVFEYRDIAQALPNDQPVYAFGLPEPESGQHFATVHHLATRYVQAMRTIQPHGPYRLCGHSFGGLVVYEMAAQLADQHQEVEFLGLLDTLHPAYKETLSRRGRAQYQLTYLCDRLVKYGRNLSSGRIDKVVTDAAAFAFQRAKRLAWRAVGNTFAKLGRPIPRMIRNDKMVLLTAWYRYAPSEYRGRVVLFNAAVRSAEYGVDRSLGWQACAGGMLNIITVPGDHYSMLHPPHVQTLVDRMLSCLPNTGHRPD